MTWRGSFCIATLAAACAATPGWASGQPSADASTPVEMGAYHVQAEYFVVNLRGHLNGIVDEAVITHVTPNTKVSGIGVRRGDRIESIDGIPVEGMKSEDFIALINRPVAAGHPQTVIVLGMRGLLPIFHRRFALVFTRVPR